MANRRPKPEEIVSKLRQVEVLLGQGMSRLDAIRQIGVVEQTYYHWRKQNGGMGVDQLKELKRLQKENEQLRRAVSDLTLDTLIMKEAAKPTNLKGSSSPKMRHASWCTLGNPEISEREKFIDSIALGKFPTPLPIFSSCQKFRLKCSGLTTYKCQVMRDLSPESVGNSCVAQGSTNPTW